jgi:hypothetical protein
VFPGREHDEVWAAIPGRDHGADTPRDVHPRPFPAASTCAASASSKDTLGHRGRIGDPLYRIRRTLRTRLALLTDRQRTRLETVFAFDEHVAVAVTWWSYQQIVAAYADPDPQRGKTLLTAVIDQLRSGLPPGLGADPGRFMRPADASVRRRSWDVTLGVRPSD